MTVMVEPQLFDFRSVGSLSESQVKTFNRVGEAFAAEAGFRMAVQLRREIGFELQGVEEIAGLGSGRSECVRFPLKVGEEGLGELRLSTTAAVQLVELRLGQRDIAEPDPSRCLTGLEKRILRVIVAELVRDIENTWGSVGDLPIRLHDTSNDTAIPAATGSSSVAMAWSLSIEGIESRMELLLPSDVVGKLLSGPRRTTSQTGSTSGLSSERLRRISLGLCARTDKTTLSLGDLRAIRPGDVLGLEVRFEEPALLEVNGKVLFAGRLVTAGGRRAIRVEQETATPEPPA